MSTFEEHHGVPVQMFLEEGEDVLGVKLLPKLDLVHGMKTPMPQVQSLTMVFTCPFPECHVGHEDLMVPVLIGEC